MHLFIYYRYKPSVLSLKKSSFSSSQPSMTYTGNNATLSLSPMSSFCK